MKVKLEPLFGELPAATENLEIVGTFAQRFEEHDWATVWPGSGVVRWQDGSVEIETIWVGKNLKDCGDYHSRWSWFPQRRRGRYFNLSLFWWQNYYHWICDVLTRLYRVCDRLEPGDQIILPQRMTSWQKRSLELVGPLNGNCLSHTGRRPWKVEQLLYVPPVAMTGDHEPESLQWVRDTIWQKLGCRSTESGWRKLFLTRKNAPSRRVVNQAELMPVLKELGFEIVDCGDLSFDEQVRLFSEAQCVVGPHGAAFTNLLWSPPGTYCFEIFEPGSVRRCYWSLCQALGHVHACGIGQAVNNPGGEAHLEILPEKFRSALEHLTELAYKTK